MTPEDEQELRRLRERAYGPAADIVDDPAALARLRELEREYEAHAAASVSSGWPAPDVDDATANGRDPQGEGEDRDEAASAEEADADVRGDDGLSAPRHPADPADADDPPTAGDAASGTGEADDPEDAPSRARLAISRRTAWLWAGSVVVALFVGAALSLAMSSWSGERAAVLAEADIEDWPSLSFGEPEEGSRIFEDYFGLTPVLVPSALGSDNQQRVPCMFVVILTDYDGGDPPGTAGSTVSAGCADGAFPPVASFTVTDASPEALREELPVGTSVQITIDGDEAHVSVRRP
ncbi:hypothetical protein ACFUTX_10675 [Microbacterium sp. NPDC057407]|uniref:hypothetical protein n=1 Tax=Microbacterium sp. NPDC057407 TaxID=3346120 RepID=UPI00366AF900